MTLGIKERLLMPLMFPQKGTKKDITLSRAIFKKIEISPEERKEIDFVSEKDHVQWSSEKAKDKDIDLNDDEREFLKRQIHRVDDDEAFTLELLALAERIELL
jgi:hypothetical protein